MASASPSSCFKRSNPPRPRSGTVEAPAPSLTKLVDVSVIGVLGFAGVGRTSLATRAATGFFTSNTRRSTGSEITPVFPLRESDATMDAVIGEHHQLVQLLVPQLKVDTDIAQCAWFPKVHAYVLCFDVTDAESFSDLENTQWYETLRRTPTVPALVVGLRADEPKASRQVRTKAAKRWCRARFLPYMEVSARTGHHVVEALQTLLVLRRHARDRRAFRGRSLSLDASTGSASH